ncbi:MAG: family oxidoreductase, partial [Phenylobacterium sp.]|nr:family oxidoreductase [Phenylobacterium sp.]
MSRLSRSVKGSRVLVTGAGSGMGRATAELFAEEGAQVAVTDYALAAAETVAADLRARGLDARAWKLDVSDPAEIAASVAEIAQALGGL